MSCHLRLLDSHMEKSILCASHLEHNGVVFLGFGMPQFINLVE